MKELVPKEYHDSWALMYDPAVMAKLAGCGVVMLDDATDVFYSAYLYLGLDLKNESPDAFRQVTALLKKLRPHIKKYDISLSAEQLASGEICMAQQWVDNLLKAQQEYAGLPDHSPITIILPKEGTLMWIDNMAIPTDAPHKEEAYQLIDFLLRPEISALITNHLYLRTALKTDKILPFIKPEIQKDKLLFPTRAYMAKVFLPGTTSRAYQRQLTRAFSQLLATY